MKYIVAVSGGVDSMALLDMLVNRRLQGPTLQSDGELVVAHFDHGIRPESDADARFVWELAKLYGLPCEIRREELGADASEATARDRRYAFLAFVAAKYGGAPVITAHHRDDLVESIAINIERGTGWRGLAVMDGPGKVRPLLDMTKQDIYDYALEHGLEWVEDGTNTSERYQRNRLRKRLKQDFPDESSAQLAELRGRQLDIRRQIDEEAKRVTALYPSSRYFFIMTPMDVSLELLRRLSDGRLTRPQLHALLHGIKTALPDTRQTLGSGLTAHFTRTDFTLENL